jgi:carbon-monoxide dehydrogenase medium subunit
MKPAAFEFLPCRDAAAAVSLLAASDGLAKPCSGTQSLGPMINLRLAQPAQLVDISRLEALRTVLLHDTVLRIGAAVTHARIEDGELPEVTRGLLPSVAAGIAYRAVRNRGTLGGSLAHADPAADWVSTMCLLDAGIAVLGRGGERTVAATGFFLGPFTTQLENDELIVAVEVPRFTAGARWAYRKLCRKPGEFAQALAAIWVDPGLGIARAVLRGLDHMPHVIDGMAGLEALKSASGVAGVLDEIGLEDPYERQLLTVMLRRALDDLETFKP